MIGEQLCSRRNLFVKILDLGSFTDPSISQDLIILTQNPKELGTKIPHDWRAIGYIENLMSIGENFGARAF